MKFLKKYNENKIEDDLLEYCNNYLAFLFDDGLHIKISNYSSNLSYINIIIKSSWNDIKETIIPFIEMLNNDYGIEGLVRINDKDYSPSDIINDKVTGLKKIGDIEASYKIIEIEIYVKTL